MDASPHLLLIEDDNDISGMVSRFMSQHGFRVSHAVDGHALDRTMSLSRIDLVLLDLLLPGDDGLAICRRLRMVSNIPIIIVTALGGEADRVAGLELGADDYLPKPFSSRELLARVRAVLRRSRLSDFSPRPMTVFRFDDWRLNLGMRDLRAPDGSRVPLTSVEFAVLAVFCQHPGQVLSREQLLDLAHGRAAALFDRSIDVQISRLRRKIERDPKDPAIIVTVRNEGYVFVPAVRDSDGTP
jgi:two-component system OmpR family response regulator